MAIAHTPRPPTCPPSERPTQPPAPDTGTDWVARPICPECNRELSDPVVGTDGSGSYTVLCKCGAWIELLRRAEIIFLIYRHSLSIPPWAYGTEV